MAKGTGGCGSARPRGGANVLAALPVLTEEAVYHVGTLNPADKASAFAHSWEGHGLSVSPCPAAWERIAKIGGQPWWELARADGSFLDAAALAPEQEEAVADWAVERGYVRRERCFYAQVYDDELDDEIRIGASSRRGAIEEALDRLGGEASLDELRAAVSSGERLVSLPPLDERVGFPAGEDCLDYTLIAYVEDERPDLDGVWWEEQYGYLSAPRAVILPDRLARWARRALDLDERAELEWIGEDAIG